MSTSVWCLRRLGWIECFLLVTWCLIEWLHMSGNLSLVIFWYEDLFFIIKRPIIPCIFYSNVWTWIIDFHAPYVYLEDNGVCVLEDTEKMISSNGPCWFLCKCNLSAQLNVKLNHRLLVLGLAGNAGIERYGGRANFSVHLLSFRMTVFG